MKRKPNPQKSKNHGVRSQTAQDAWNRAGGIHSDQRPNHKKGRQNAKSLTREYGASEYD